MRYCSARQIAPASVNEAVIDGYMRYRAEDHGAGQQRRRPARHRQSLERLCRH